MSKEISAAFSLGSQTIKIRISHKGILLLKKKHGLKGCTRNQIEAQRSGFDLERRSSGVSAL